MEIPLYRSEIEKEEVKQVRDSIDSGWISPKAEGVRSFEEKFLEFNNSEHGFALDSGTTSLELALEIIEDGNVVVPNLTFGASAIAVKTSDRDLVFADVDRDTMGLDPESVKKKITEDTAAIVAVHLFGQPCNIQEINELAEKNDIALIEDCSQALGASLKGRKTGNFGDLAYFSFSWNKSITTGKGGFLIAGNQDINRELKKLLDYGREDSEWRYKGHNYSMDNIRASIGLGQISRLNKTINRKKELVRHYNKKIDLDNSEMLTLDQEDVNISPWCFYILVEKKKRDKIIQRLENEGIGSKRFYTPLDSREVFEEGDNLSTSYDLSKKGIMLPLYTGLSKKEIDKIANVINEYV